MKQSWLFFALALWGAIYMNSLFVCVLIFLVIGYFHIRHFSKGHGLFLIFLLLALIRIQPRQPTLPTNKVIVIQEIKSNYVVASCDDQKVLVYGVKDVSLSDVIEVQGDFERIDGVHNSPGFYFPDWCSRRNIFYGIQVESYEVKQQGKGLAHDLYSYIQTQPTEKKQILNELLYGIHEEDVSYMITSSGMHIVTFWQVIRSMLSIFFSNSVLEVVCFIGMGIHAYLTVFSSTMLRILSFQLIRFLCPSLDTKDRLGCSMVLILMIAPYMAYELSFIIPVAFQLVSIFDLTHINKRVISFLVLIPIQFACLQQVDMLSIVFFPMLRKLYAVLYASALVILITPFPVSMVLGYRNILEQLSANNMVWVYAPTMLWIGYWILFLSRYLTEKKKRYVVQLMLMLLYTQVSCYLDPFGEVYMLDVGQGDCTIITLPFHQGVIMIDAMGSLYKDIPKDIIVPVLKKKHIDRIDLLIVTHDDYDHSGGVEELTHLVDVKQIITTKQSEDIYVKGVPIHFLNADFEGQDANENSIVTYFEMYDTGFLFMGDAGHEAESHILQTYADLKVDVLKAGHHGSKTSSSPEFLHHYQPILALISAGRNNRYGHPHKEVMQLLEKERVYPLVTSVHGGVSIRFCKFFRFFKTADNDFGIIE